MALKDYYQILQVDAGADRATIKKAYRRLAMQYHPDKQADATATHYFRDIQEAYEILSDPGKREQYHYERWLEQSMGNKMEGFMPAHQIIQLIIKTEQYLSGTDKFRMNSYQLLHYLLNLFSNSRIETLITEDDASIENTCIGSAMRMSADLKSDCQIQLQERFKNILKRHPLLNDSWSKQIASKIKLEKREKQMIPILIIAVVVACILFYILSKQP